MRSKFILQGPNDGVGDNDCHYSELSLNGNLRNKTETSLRRTSHIGRGPEETAPVLLYKNSL